MRLGIDRSGVGIVFGSYSIVLRGAVSSGSISNSHDYCFLSIFFLSILLNAALIIRHLSPLNINFNNISPVKST
jgi:hypothetical protein